MHLPNQTIKLQPILAGVVVKRPVSVRELIGSIPGRVMPNTLKVAMPCTPCVRTIKILLFVEGKTDNCHFFLRAKRGKLYENMSRAKE